MTTAQILAVLGLVVGLVVLLLVIKLLNDTLAPLLAIRRDVEAALTAPMLKNGVPGTEQLGQTRRLADSIPPLALAYLSKLGASPAPPPPPAPAQAPSYFGASQQSSAQSAQPEPPAWKKYITK